MKFPIWWESHSKFHGSKPPSSSCFFPPTSSGDDYDIHIFLDIQIKHDEKPRFFTRATLHSLHLFMMSPLSPKNPTKNPRRVSAEWHLYVARPERIPRNRRPESRPSLHRWGFFAGVLFQGWPKKGSWDDRHHETPSKYITKYITKYTWGYTVTCLPFCNRVFQVFS